MDTDLDHDDAIGRRFGALHSWAPPAPADDAWRGVEARRARRRARRYAAAAVVVILTLVGTVAAVANYRSSDRRVLVTPPQDPPIVHVLTPAPVGNITVSPSGPFRAGQSVRAFVGPSPSFRLDDPGNQSMELCFEYAGGEICDTAVQSSYDTVSRAYELTLPGWAHTPTGLQSCSDVACRLEIDDGYGARIGTAPLAIDAGPKPVERARIDAIHADGTISLHVDGLLPDPSWTALNLSPKADFPPGNLAVCAFAGRLICDGLLQPDPPPFDGAPHDLTIETNRLLLTSDGWTDCAEYACAISIGRETDVTNVSGGIASGFETVAIVPYQLPSTTPVMERPTLTIDRAGPYAVDDVVSVTLHDPPAHVDAARRLRLGQCAADDLRRAMACATRFSDFSQQTQSWTRLANGSLQQRWRIAACNDARGCYLAIEPPVKGHPEVARTPGRFTVSP